MWQPDSGMTHPFRRRREFIAQGERREESSESEGRGSEKLRLSLDCMDYMELLWSI